MVSRLKIGMVDIVSSYPPLFFSFFPFLLDSSRLFSLVIGGWIVRQESSEFWIEISRGKARSIQKGGATGDFFPVE